MSTELFLRSSIIWSDSFFILSSFQFDLAQFSKSLLSISLNCFPDPLKTFSNIGFEKEKSMPWNDFLSDLLFLESHSSLLFTASKPALLNRIDASVQASASPSTSGFKVGSPFESIGIWLFITPFDVVDETPVKVKLKFKW